MVMTLNFMCKMKLNLILVVENILYYLMNGLQKPKKENVEIDTALIKTKSEHWMKIIDEVIEDSKEKSLESGVR
jgi:N-acetylneuraminic acid mutarotase